MTGSVVKSVFENFDFLHECQIVVVWSHLQHESLFNIDENLSRVPIFPNQQVQRVGSRNPSEKSRVRAERNNWIAFDIEVSFETFRVGTQ
jgi:hypothetical protein